MCFISEFVIAKKAFYNMIIMKGKGIKVKQHVSYLKQDISSDVLLSVATKLNLFGSMYPLCTCVVAFFTTGVYLRHNFERLSP